MSSRDGWGGGVEKYVRDSDGEGRVYAQIHLWVKNVLGERGRHGGIESRETRPSDCP